MRRENWIEYGMNEFESMIEEDFLLNIYPFRPPIPPVVVNTNDLIFKNYRCK